MIVFYVYTISLVVLEEAQDDCMFRIMFADKNLLFMHIGLYLYVGFHHWTG